MCIGLGLAGATVYANSRSSERCQLLINELIDLGVDARAAVFDVTDSQAAKSFAGSLLGEALHVLINNAYSGQGGTVETSSSEQFSKSFDSIVVAANGLFLEVLPNLRHAVSECGEASVINIASMYGVVSPDQSIYSSAEGTNPPFYGAAKSALIQWTRYAACEFGKESIRINAISPGPFPSTEAISLSPNLVASLAQKVPMRRVGRAQEIRGAVQFLASSASSYVNGANLCVDGGWTSW
jgi:NAD(P)-dependent dehydrogenase (short-subunit alcohol dehydrogenase family)